MMAEEPQTPTPGSQPLANPKWEKFAQLLAKGQCQTDAYQIAGYKPDTGNAAKLATKPGITARVLYLRGMRGTRDKKPDLDPGPELPQAKASIEDIKPTRAYILTGLVENAEIALGRRLTTSTVIVRRRGKEPLTFQVEITDRNGTVANRALELLGKELGLFEGKGEEVGQDRPHIAARLKEFTAERLIAALRENPEKPEEPEA